MGIATILSELSLRRLVGFPSTGASAGTDVALAHLNRQISRALRQANARAWIAVEILVHGEQFWQRAQLTWERHLDESFFQPIREFIDAYRLDLSRPFTDEHRHSALHCLDLAHRRGTLISGALDATELVRSTPHCSVDDIAAELAASDLASLAEVVVRATEMRPTFLADLVADIFRGIVLADADLFGEFAALVRESPDGADNFKSMATTLDKHRAQIEALLRKLRDRGEDQATEDEVEHDVPTRLKWAQTLVQRGEYDAAVAEFTAVLRVDASLVPALAGRGDAYRFQGDYESALSDYNLVLTIDPRNTATLLGRGQAHYHRRNLIAAQGDLSAVLSDDPQNRRALHFRGKVHNEIGKPEAAIADLTQALEHGPSPSAFHDRGEAFAALENWNRAVSDFNEALRLNPDMPQTYVRLADVYVHLSQHDRAIVEYSRALELDPSNVSALLKRSSSQQRLNRLDDALADLDRALELAPDRTSAYFERAQVLVSLGDPPAALEDLSEVLRRDPENAAAFDLRGQVNAALGDPQQALADFDAALSLDSTAERVYTHRARALLRLGRLDEAIDDCNRALAIDADLVPALIARGSARAQLNRLVPAIDDFTAALHRDTANTQALYLRGTAFLRTGQSAPAMSDFNAVIRFDRNHARAHAQRAFVYREAGDHERTLDDLATAARLDDRYAADYCRQLATLHLRQGEYGRAAADLTLVLLFDPEDSDSQAARREALEALQKTPRRPTALAPGGSLPTLTNVAPVAPSPPPSVPVESSAATAQSAPFTMPAATAVSAAPNPAFEKPRDPKPSKTPESTQAPVLDPPSVADEPAPSLVAECLDFDPETELATDLLHPETSDGQASPDADQDVTVADGAAASDTAIEFATDRESTSPKIVSLEEEAQRRERQLLVQLEQERREKLNELMRRAKGGVPPAGQSASPSRKKPIVQERDDDDEREPLSLWKKGGIGISSVVGLWLLWSVGSHYLEIARARSPITLDGLCQEFATDVETARKKYDGGCFALTGKAEFVKSGKDVVLAIQTPNVPEWSIRCRFDMTPKLYKSRIVDRIQAGQEVTVEGRCSYEPRAGKGVIQMEECILRDGS